MNVFCCYFLMTMITGLDWSIFGRRKKESLKAYERMKRHGSLSHPRIRLIDIVVSDDEEEVQRKADGGPIGLTEEDVGESTIL